MGETTAEAIHQGAGVAAARVDRWQRLRAATGPAHSNLDQRIMAADPFASLTASYTNLKRLTA